MIDVNTFNCCAFVWSFDENLLGILSGLKIEFKVRWRAFSRCEYCNRDVDRDKSFDSDRVFICYHYTPHNENWVNCQKDDEYGVWVTIVHVAAAHRMKQFVQLSTQWLHLKCLNATFIDSYAHFINRLNIYFVIFVARVTEKRMASWNANKMTIDIDVVQSIS